MAPPYSAELPYRVLLMMVALPALPIAPPNPLLPSTLLPVNELELIVIGAR